MNEADPLAPGATVFIVDDDASIRRALSRLFASVGLRAEAFEGATDFLARAPRDSRGCIVLDIRMPTMDGYECAQRMRETDAGRDVAIVAVSGWGQAEHKRRTEAAGFDHHLTKPVDWRALRALLAAIGS